MLPDVSVYLLVPTESRNATSSNSGTRELASVTAETKKAAVEINFGIKTSVSVNLPKSASSLLPAALNLNGTRSTVNV